MTEYRLCPSSLRQDTRCLLRLCRPFSVRAPGKRYQAGVRWPSIRFVRPIQVQRNSRLANPTCPGEHFAATLRVDTGCLAEARGSETTLRVCDYLQSRDREGAVRNSLFQHPVSLGETWLPAPLDHRFRNAAVRVCMRAPAKITTVDSTLAPNCDSIPVSGSTPARRLPQPACTTSDPGLSFTTAPSA